MRVLILGGSGMLGHKLWQSFSTLFDTYVTFRTSADDQMYTGLFDPARTVRGVSAEKVDSVARALANTRPDVVVNCIGIVKQDAAAKDPAKSIAVNALFPHQLAQQTRERGARLIHLSTDCVFSGREGGYTEQSKPDAEDLYGRTKTLGEVAEEGCLTIRTSMIGRELAGAHGLLEWFLSQNGQHVRGFKRAIFSGFTTHALAETIADIISDHPQLAGIRHVAATPINKFDLLSLIKDAYRLTTHIEPDDTFVCDRSLDDTRFRLETGTRAKTWPQMIEELRADPTPYQEIRRTDAA